MEIKDFLHFYLPYEINVSTPDGIAKLVGLPWAIRQQDRVRVHFGKMVKTKNSIDGWYDKVRNHGDYAIHAMRYEPIGSTGITEDGFDTPGGVIPILRTTQSITQSEWDKAPKSSLHIGTDGVFYSPELFNYLLSLHVDLFGLIEKGLALDESRVSANGQTPQTA